MVCEAYYLVDSLWEHQYYFMYFYLFLSFNLMTYVAWTASIVQTYVSLSVGDYNWWWRSYLLGFIGGVHIYAVCAILFMQRQSGVSVALDLSYMVWSLIMCTLVGLVAAAASFTGSFFFVLRIYTQAQTDKEK